MSTTAETLLTLPAKPVSFILAELGELRKKSLQDKTVQVPLAAFHLRSGKELCGWLLAISDSGEVLIQSRHAEVHPSTYSLSYFQAQDVAAISLHDVAPIIERLKF